MAWVTCLHGIVGPGAIQPVGSHFQRYVLGRATVKGCLLISYSSKSFFILARLAISLFDIGQWLLLEHKAILLDHWSSCVFRVVKLHCNYLNNSLNQLPKSFELGFLQISWVVQWLMFAALHWDSSLVRNFLPLFAAFMLACVELFFNFLLRTVYIWLIIGVDWDLT